MFVKIKQEVLKEQDANKSWYRDVENECDLFIWLNTSDNLKHFQLWYKNNLLEWDRQKGLKSGSLDEETGSFKNYQSPSYHYHRSFNNELALKMIGFLGDSLEANEERNILTKIIEMLRKSIQL